MSRLQKGLTLILAVIAVPSLAWAAETPPRVAVPIHQTVLSDGAVRYWIPVTVGGNGPVKAMLDTGSFGLRILAQATPPDSYTTTGVQRTYAFQSGASLHGIIAEALVDIGGAAAQAPIPIQVVQSVDCVPAKPACPVSKVSARDYLIGGDGLAGEGFPAIIGLSLRSAGVVPAANNPLGLIGVRTWIITLPLPGDAAPGQIILNPGRAETARFKLFQMPRQPAREAGAGGGGRGEARAGTNADRAAAGWQDLVIKGCLGAEGAREFCGATRVDSGGGPKTIAPFLAFSVFYDQVRGKIGFRPRSAARTGGEPRP